MNPSIKSLVLKEAELSAKVIQELELEVLDWDTLFSHGDIVRLENKRLIPLIIQLAEMVEKMESKLLEIDESNYGNTSFESYLELVEKFTGTALSEIQAFKKELG